MRKSYLFFIIFVFILTFILIPNLKGSDNTKITNNSGQFSSSAEDVIVIKYNVNKTTGFFVNLNFSLIQGKVNWEITDPDESIIYKGYVENLDAHTYAQITYPTIPYWSLPVEGQDNESTFNYIQIDSPNKIGTYRLKIMPQNSDGSYQAVWHDQLPRK